MGVLRVSEVDADRGGRRCQAWTVGRGPWTVAWDLLGVAVQSYVVGAVGGRWVGAVLSCAGLRCRRSWVQKVATERAALLGRRKNCGTSGQQEREREQKLRLRLRCGAVDAVGGCFVLIVEISSVQSTRATVDGQQGGARGLTTRGYQKKMSEDGRLIQICATKCAAARVKLAR